MTDEVKQPTKDEIQVGSWNKNITPRSEAILSWFRRPEYTEGIKLWYEEQVELDMKMLLKGGTTTLDDKFQMGRLAMLREILALPHRIEMVVSAKDHKGATPQGPAGY